MSARKPNPRLLGYADRLWARPGERLAFKVSSLAEAPFTARLTRSICADPNPSGPGIVEEDASEHFAPLEVPSTERPFHPGSYGIAPSEIAVADAAAVELSAIVFPTLRTGRPQTILSVGELDLHLDPSGALALRLRDRVVSTGSSLSLRRWHRVEARIAGDVATLTQTPLGPRPPAPVRDKSRIGHIGALSGAPVVAARIEGGIARDHFNGKIEAPRIGADGTALGAWDFSRNISSTTAHASAGPDLTLINFPTRAVTGAKWDGSEMNWTHRPEHYAAIHFHEDDIYDFGWETDFTFTLPPDMPSGVYVMRLECDGQSDAIPFFVCPPAGQRNADLCLLVSTFTYTVYGNHARPDFDPSWHRKFEAWGAYPHNPAEFAHYGLSTYNCHSDGSGIAHASHRRPLFNLRPGYITFGATDCSGLRHFQADSHLVSWLHAQGIGYDLVTDDILHREGAAALAGYKTVMTGSHPEYHTKNTLDALRDHRDDGGSLMYLGGNGFYWRIALHPEDDGLLEIRRAEAGIRAWAAEPGEYYNAFDGAYGGLWRRNARPPQDLVAVGFAAQGEFFGDPYRRVCLDPALDWVFEGIEDEILGDFGLSGGGAAGFELDHMDHRLGTPEGTILLARSVTRESGFMLVPEEQLTHLTNLTGGPARDAMHADMVLASYPGGGRVFSTGSITFCGSLPWNGFDNNISRLCRNVLLRFLA